MLQARLKDVPFFSGMSKKELAAISRQTEKYSKSLEGIRKMERLPSALFIIDVGKESIAVQEAKRLCIPIVGVVDSNNSPRDIDFMIPGNDDAIRAIDLYCTAVANACLEGYEWPGNLRELGHLIERAVLTCPETATELDADMIEAPAAGRRDAADEARTGGGGLSLEASERAMIERALQESKGNQTRAAQLLGITRDTLRYRMAKFKMTS